MSFHTILGETPYHLKPSEIVYPSYFEDLNLDQIITRILENRDDYDLKKYFYYPVTKKEVLVFRREVFLALSDASVRKVFTDFSMALKKAEQYLGYASKAEKEIKRRYLLFDAAKFYSRAVLELFNKLKNYDFKSEGLSSFLAFLKEYCDSSDFRQLSLDTDDIRLKPECLSFRMELCGTKITLYDDYETFDAREEMLKRCGQQDTAASSFSMKSPFTNILELEELEALLLSMLKTQHKDVFLALENFEKEHDGFLHPILTQFSEEIQVYLAVWDFISSMQSYGFSFACPHTVSMEENSCEQRKFELRASYDLALACKHCFSPEKTVRNDAYLLSHEHFFVVTGPNQGGKTTFARAVGQAVYFHQMGFFVPGKKACLPVFSKLYTHFSSDEDVSSGDGKLKEELKRLVPMLHSSHQNGFVILNELFTTATTYDAVLMGKQILQAFINKNFCGIYVTHIQELSNAQNAVVSMVAQVDKEDEATRTYQILREESKGLAYAQTIAGKYRLSKEEILQRLTE